MKKPPIQMIQLRIPLCISPKTVDAKANLPLPVRLIVERWFQLLSAETSRVARLVSSRIAGCVRNERSSRGCMSRIRDGRNARLAGRSFAAEFQAGSDSLGALSTERRCQSIGDCLGSRATLPQRCQIAHLSRSSSRSDSASALKANTDETNRWHRIPILVGLI